MNHPSTYAEGERSEAEEGRRSSHRRGTRIDPVDPHLNPVPCARTATCDTASRLSLSLSLSLSAPRLLHVSAIPYASNAVTATRTRGIASLPSTSATIRRSPQPPLPPLRTQSVPRRASHRPLSWPALAGILYTYQPHEDMRGRGESALWSGEQRLSAVTAATRILLPSPVAISAAVLASVASVASVASRLCVRQLRG